MNDGSYHEDNWGVPSGSGSGYGWVPVPPSVGRDSTASSHKPLTADGENVSSTISNSMLTGIHCTSSLSWRPWWLCLVGACCLITDRFACHAVGWRARPRHQILVSWCALVSRITAAYYSCLLLEPRDAFVSSRHVIIRAKNIIHQNP